MTGPQWLKLGMGAFLMLVAVIYSGSFDGAFVRGRRPPDHPPKLIVRIIFFIAGVLVIWDALTSAG